MQSDQPTEFNARSQPASRLHAVVELHAAVLSQTSMAGAAAAFASGLAQRLDYDRIALGIVKGTRIETLARSDRLGAESDAPLVARLNAAMAEAVDQRASVVVPETRARSSSHHAGASRAVGIRARQRSTVPLMAGDMLVGALCAERHGGRGMTAADIETREYLSCQTGPVLELMRRNERGPLDRLRDAARRRLLTWRQADGMTRRIASAGAALLLGVLLLVPTERRASPAGRGGSARRGCADGRASWAGSASLKIS